MNPNKQLTKRQREALEFINSFISKNGYSPSVRDVAKGLGIKSSSTAFGLVQKLESAGVIKKREPGAPRTLALTGDENDIEKLRVENATLRAENAELKERLSELGGSQ